MSAEPVSLDALRGMMAKARQKLAAAEREHAAGFSGEAVSRAYYAVFHAVSAALAAKRLSFSSHGQVLGAFNREFVKTGVFPTGTTRGLQRLFEHRQMADYDWTSATDPQTAAEDLADATAIVQACEDYLRQSVSGYAAG